MRIADPAGETGLKWPPLSHVAAAESLVEPTFFHFPITTHFKASPTESAFSIGLKLDT